MIGRYYKFTKNLKTYDCDNKNKIVLSSKNILSDGIWNNVGLAIKIALDLNIPRKTILRAMPKINFEGRLQYVRSGKLKKLLYPQEELLVDGCHSETSAKNLASYLKTLNKDIYGIWGMQSHKQPEFFIRHFKKIFKKIVVIKIPDEPNTCNTQELKKIANQQDIECYIASDIKSATKKCFQSLNAV